MIPVCMQPSPTAAEAHCAVASEVASNAQPPGEAGPFEDSGRSSVGSRVAPNASDLPLPMRWAASANTGWVSWLQCGMVSDNLQARGRHVRLIM